MIRLGDILGGLAPSLPLRGDVDRKTADGLPLLVRAPDGSVGRVVESNATAARIQFEEWDSTRGAYRTLGRESEWIPLRRLAPVRGAA